MLEIYRIQKSNKQQLKRIKNKIKVVLIIALITIILMVMHIRSEIIVKAIN
jgi:hypothetical protein